MMMRGMLRSERKICHAMTSRHHHHRSRLLYLLLACLSITTSSSYQQQTDRARAARDALFKDAFLSMPSVLDGLWFEDGAREVIAGKMLAAKWGGRPFVVAFGGTSITAAHDNYYNESYPEVFRRALAPVKIIKPL